MLGPAELRSGAGPDGGARTGPDGAQGRHPADDDQRRPGRADRRTAELRARPGPAGGSSSRPGCGTCCGCARSSDPSAASPSGTRPHRRERRRPRSSAADDPGGGAVVGVPAPVRDAQRPQTVEAVAVRRRRVRASRTSDVAPPRPGRPSSAPHRRRRPSRTTAGCGDEQPAGVGGEQVRPVVGAGGEQRARGR